MPQTTETITENWTLVTALDAAIVVQNTSMTDVLVWKVAAAPPANTDRNGLKLNPTEEHTFVPTATGESLYMRTYLTNPRAGGATVDVWS